MYAHACFKRTKTTLSQNRAFYSAPVDSVPVYLAPTPPRDYPALLFLLLLAFTSRAAGGQGSARVRGSTGKATARPTKK
eukprot:10264649-Heterocapsa_arctica.AAC.1